jgi:photosystem II stability/assembly factor-like uncharacterized protein
MVRRAALFPLLLALLLSCVSGPAVAQTLTWKPTSGPEGGDVWAIKADGIGHLYATVVRGGVFRSDDGGNSWKEINTGLWNTYAGDLLVLPDKSLMLAAGSWLFASVDFGDTWTALPFDPRIGESRRLAMTTDGGTIFLAGNGTGIFRSRDRGQTWEQRTPSGYVFDIAIDPSNESTVYAALGQFTPFGLYRSTDGGDTFDRVESLPDVGTYSLRAVTVLPVTPALPQGRILVSEEGCTGVGKYDSQAPGYFGPWGDVYVSDDGGANWTTERGGMYGCFAQQFVRDETGALWAPRYQNAGVVRSPDAGLTWQEVGLSPKDFRTVLITGDTLFAGSSQSGIWRAQLANPASAVPANTGLRGADTRKVLALDRNHLLAGTVFGVQRTADGGATWQTVFNGPVGYDGVTTMLGRTPRGTIIAWVNGLFLRSFDDGLTWTTTPSYDNGTWTGAWMGGDAFAVHADGTLVIGGGADTTAGVWVSHDDGVNFAAFPGPGAGILSMAFDAAGELYAGTLDGVYKSSDTGATWASLALPGRAVRSLIADGDTLYASVDWDGVYRSADHGVTWEKRSTAWWPQAFALVMNADGALFVNYGDHVAGSYDDGATWIEFADGFDRFGTNIQGLALDPEGYLYAASWGGGVYRSNQTTLLAKRVTLDIWPFIDKNPILPHTPTLIPVAIVSAPDFSARSVKPSTVRFGRTGTEALPATSLLVDLNHDGVRDLLMFFWADKTGIECGDTQAMLTGKTNAGTSIRGSDSILTLCCAR